MELHPNVTAVTQTKQSSRLRTSNCRFSSRANIVCKFDTRNIAFAPTQSFTSPRWSSLIAAHPDLPRSQNVESSHQTRCLKDLTHSRPWRTFNHHSKLYTVPLALPPTDAHHRVHMSLPIIILCTLITQPELSLARDLVLLVLFLPGPVPPWNPKSAHNRNSPPLILSYHHRGSS